MNQANRANVMKFEAGKVTLASLLRYVFRLNRAEFRWIVFSMVFLASSRAISIGRLADNSSTML